MARERKQFLMTHLQISAISTFLGQALNGKKCKAAAQKLDKMSTIAVIMGQYLKNYLSTMTVFHVER